MMLLQVILSCVFCSTVALHPLTSDVNVDTDVADVYDEPDVLNMLNFFKGKSNIGELTTFLKHYKSSKTVAMGLMDVCLPCKEVYADASKSNAGIRILDKMIQGHVPDIKDMYDLATKGIGHMSVSLHAAQAKNKKFMEITRMLSKGSAMFSSVPLLEEFLNDLTGKQFTLDPTLLKELNDGSVNVSKTNLAQVNLLLMMSTWAENYRLYYDIGLGFTTPPFDFIKPMKMLQSFNISSLSKVKAINENMKDNKYTVSGGKMAFVTDPGVVKVLQKLQNMNHLVKAKSQDESTAESLVLGTFTDFISLTFRIINNAENPRKEPMSPL